MHCPRCDSHKVQCSRVRFRWEVWRRQVTGKRPYRCFNCGWRGWALDAGPSFSPDQTDAASRAMRPDPPTLKDVSLARETSQLADVDLSKLDRDISSRREAAPKR
jgi:hypothetical protein